MQLLGLSEDELCTILDTDALSLLSGQVTHDAELRILLDLLAEPAAARGSTMLARWVRASGPAGRPLDRLLARDFAGFEDALVELDRHGFVLRVDRA